MQKKIAELLQNLNLPTFVWNLVIVAIAIIVGLMFKGILTLLLRQKAAKQRQYSFFHSLLKHIGRPLTWFLPIFILNLLLPLLELDPVYIATINHIIEIGLIVTFAWLLIQSIRVVQDFVFHKYDLNKSDNFRERKVRTQLQYIRQVLTGLIILLTIAAVLFTFSTMRQIGAGLLTGVGVGGIIIGFAAQKSLGNLLAGFQIAFTQPIRIDDVVLVEGEYGRIEEITLTYVVVHIWDNRRLILPINYFIDKPFQNWTRTSTELLGTVFIYADYSLPMEPLREELNRLLKETPLWNGKASGLVITNVKERTVEIRAVVSAENSSQTFDLRCYVREGLIKFVNDNYPDCLPKTRAEIESVTDNSPEPVAQT